MSGTPFWLRVHFVVVAAEKKIPLNSVALCHSITLESFPLVWGHGVNVVFKAFGIPLLFCLKAQSETSSSGGVVDPDLCSQKFSELHFQRETWGFCSGWAKERTNETL